MSARLIPVDPFDLVVFGGTGDLAMRKLLPGLYHRDVDEQLTPESRIIGVAASNSSNVRIASLIDFARKTAADCDTASALLSRLFNVGFHRPTSHHFTQAPVA